MVIEIGPRPSPRGQEGQQRRRYARHRPRRRRTGRSRPSSAWPGSSASCAPTRSRLQSARWRRCLLWPVEPRRTCPRRAANRRSTRGFSRRTASCRASASMKPTRFWRFARRASVSTHDQSRSTYSTASHGKPATSRAVLTRGRQDGPQTQRPPLHHRLRFHEDKVLCFS